jgi:hypothetical protein
MRDLHTRGFQRTSFFAGATTLSIMALSIMIFSLTINKTQQQCSIMEDYCFARCHLYWNVTKNHYAECNYAECRYDECRGTFSFRL